MTRLLFILLLIALFVLAVAGAAAQLVKRERPALLPRPAVA